MSQKKSEKEESGSIHGTKLQADRPAVRRRGRGVPDTESIETLSAVEGKAAQRVGVVHVLCYMHP